ncbi:MAG TPA: undecaprenyldiphospho-muramoylpentapeptide beta-N-acetylglucosaminyltransferase [Salinarimonas sp.]|nr:undecaprenyldiphospho-muramoylpentapeptide beta-N-acetylglucosaminyltransferase [Salinarimonas sp.]
MSAPLVVIAAGGTGGHLFPAQALADVLRRLGTRVVLVTDERVDTYMRDFPAEEIVTVASATPSVRSLPRMALAGLTLGRGVLQATGVLRRLRPAAVVGFGGYPTVPPVLAGQLTGVPTIIHEQNAVMGRANRLLARRARLVATGFPEVAGVPSTPARRAHTGNPVRPAVVAASHTLFPPALRGGKLKLLVFGGSQGARVMSDVVPAAVETLPDAHRARLTIVQQAREEDLARVREAYAGAGVEARVEPFFRDLPGLMADSHLVIARSGASTVAELAVIGRPAILVPLPGALDQDQAANARALGAIGAAIVLPQPEFTPERVAAELSTRFEDPDLLTRAALAAKTAGIADAAERLAAEVVALARIALPGGTTP